MSTTVILKIKYQGNELDIYSIGKVAFLILTIYN